jgi:hypothetical protein
MAPSGSDKEISPEMLQAFYGALQAVVEKSIDFADFGIPRIQQRAPYPHFS